MDLDQIKALIDAMAASDLTELEASEDGWTLRLVGAGARRRLGAAASGRRLRAACRAHAARTGRARRPDEPAPSAAPLYGIVHLQPSPGAPPSSSPGRPSRPAQTLCVIEAMKVFNDIRAERDGSRRSRAGRRPARRSRPANCSCALR